jgi:hypothetical protein
VRSQSRERGAAAAAVLAAGLGALGLARLLDRDRAARDAEPVARSAEELVEGYHLRGERRDRERRRRIDRADRQGSEHREAVATGDAGARFLDRARRAMPGGCSSMN